MAVRHESGYFDKNHFGACLKAAIKERYPSVSTFAFYNFRDMARRSVQQWTEGICMPSAECMKRLAIIFGADEVKSWLKFTF